MKGIILLLIITIPSIVLGQEREWNSIIQGLNSQLKNINRIEHFANNNNFGSELDSLSIENNSDFEEVLLTLYHTEMSFESNADYYVVGMDIPLLELTNLEKKPDQQIILVWSKYCNLGSTPKGENIVLNTSSEMANEKIYSAFEELLYIRNAYHNRLHESNQCTLEEI